MIIYEHPFAYMKNEYWNAKIDYQFLILGTFPSRISRDSGFFYGNKGNLFWFLLDESFGDKDSKLSCADNESKKIWLCKKKIALYDVIESYESEEYYSNDDDLFKKGQNHQYAIEFIEIFLEKYPNTQIFVTSRKAERLFQDHFQEVLQHKNQSFAVRYLPSPSPNHRISREKKLQEWKKAFSQKL